MYPKSYHDLVVKLYLIYYPESRCDLVCLNYPKGYFDLVPVPKGQDDLVVKFNLAYYPKCDIAYDPKYPGNIRR